MCRPQEETLTDTSKTKCSQNAKRRRHKTATDVDIKHIRCEKGDCQRWAAFGSMKDGIKKRCREHAFADDSYLRAKTKSRPKVCQGHGCNRTASWAFPSEPPKYCKQHKDRAHVDVRHRYVCLSFLDVEWERMGMCSNATRAETIHRLLRIRCIVVLLMYTG
jgi:hypothetical protein